MADATEIAEIAADGVADGMHIVSEEALAAERAVRGMNRTGLAYLGLGLVAGAAAGALVAFRIAYKQAETKYSEIAAEEIAEMRQYYHDKVVALDSSKQKADLDDIVRERGYSAVEEEATEPPMAVTPPQSVIDASQDEIDVEAIESDEVDEEIEPEVHNIFENTQEIQWDAQKERQRRSPLAPYVIHRDERYEFEHYDEVTFTYYDEDDVLANEREEAVAGDDRERLIGEANLEKFGYGSGDPNVVYIRNDQLEMVFEVLRSPNSYTEEVHGFNPPPEIRHAHRRRGAFDDE